jgi:hypothetical protein
MFDQFADLLPQGRQHGDQDSRGQRHTGEEAKKNGPPSTAVGGGRDHGIGVPSRPVLGCRARR